MTVMYDCVAKLQKYRMSSICQVTQVTRSDKKWQKKDDKWQEVTKSDKKWQKVTRSDKLSDKKWQAKWQEVTKKRDGSNPSLTK